MSSSIWLDNELHRQEKFDGRQTASNKRSGPDRGPSLLQCFARNQFARSQLSCEKPPRNNRAYCLLSIVYCLLYMFYFSAYLLYRLLLARM